MDNATINQEILKEFGIEDIRTETLGPINTLYYTENGHEKKVVYDETKVIEAGSWNYNILPAIRRRGTLLRYNSPLEDIVRGGNTCETEITTAGIIVYAKIIQEICEKMQTLFYLTSEQEIKDILALKEIREVFTERRVRLVTESKEMNYLLESLVEGFAAGIELDTIGQERRWFRWTRMLIFLNYNIYAAKNRSRLFKNISSQVATHWILRMVLGKEYSYMRNQRRFPDEAKVLVSRLIVSIPEKMHLKIREGEGETDRYLMGLVCAAAGRYLRRVFHEEDVPRYYTPTNQQLIQQWSGGIRLDLLTMYQERVIHMEITGAMRAANQKDAEINRWFIHDSVKLPDGTWLLSNQAETPNWNGVKIFWKRVKYVYTIMNVITNNNSGWGSCEEPWSRDNTDTEWDGTSFRLISKNDSKAYPQAWEGEIKQIMETTVRKKASIDLEGQHKMYRSMVKPVQNETELEKAINAYTTFHKIMNMMGVKNDTITYLSKEQGQEIRLRVITKIRTDEELNSKYTTADIELYRDVMRIYMISTFEEDYPGTLFLTEKKGRS